MQIGEDRWASRFLKELDDDLKGDTKDKVPRVSTGFPSSIYSVREKT